MRKLLTWLLGVLMVAAVGALAFGAYRFVPSLSAHIETALGNPPKATLAHDTSAQNSVDPGTTLDQPAPPTGTLTDQFGHKESLAAFRGKVVLLTFIDPLSLGQDTLTAKILSNLHTLLGSHAKDVQILAIDANPSGTSVENVRAWSTQENMLHTWLYLTGPASKLQSIWKAYNIYDVKAANGTIEHPPAVYLIGPQGKERWLYLTSNDSSRATVLRETQVVATHVAPLLPPGAALKPLSALPGTSGKSTQGQAASFTLPTLNTHGHAGTISLGHGSPMLLEVFSTWCTDCKRELPILNQYAQAASQQHLPQVVGVNLELSEASRSVVRSWIKTQHMTYPVALDTHGTVSSHYGVSALPTQILISKDGSVLWTHEGLIQEKALLQAVKNHLT